NEQYVKEREERGGAGTLQHSEERKAKYQADLLEITLAKERSEVIVVEDLPKIIDPVIVSTRSTILGISKHAARERGDPTLEAYLDDYMRRVLDELASIPVRLFSIGKASGGDRALLRDIPGAAKVKSERMGRPQPKAQRRGKRRKRSVADKQGGIPREIMDVITDPLVEEVTLMKSVRTGGTQT